MAWGVLRIGPMELHELDILDDVTNANTLERSVRFQGSETVPGMTMARLSAIQEDIGTLMGRTFPVVFQRKAEYDGFYKVNDVGSQFEKWVEGPGQARWNISLTFIGPGNAVGIESRLANVVRFNAFDLPGERWHAPAIGHTSYHVGAASPGFMVRESEDGPITVYRDIPAGANPRWHVSPDGYLGGRARVRVAGIERAGTGIAMAGSGWEVDNGLVKISPSSQGILVSSWSDGSWKDKEWSVFTSASDLAAPYTGANVLRNDPECVTVRVYKTLSPVGSFMMDLTVRRGSRFVEGFLQRSTAAEEMKVRLVSGEAFTDNSSSGYVVASADDANGDRFVIGSAKDFVPHANGGIVLEDTASLDFFLGVARGGGSAVAGDLAEDLRDQYIGVMPEKTGVSRR